MSRRIYFDGLNLSLERGTGIATYTRKLAQIVRDLGFEVGVVYSSPGRNARDAAPGAYPKKVWAVSCEQRPGPFGVAPRAVDPAGAGITAQLQDRLPLHDHVFVARNLL